MNASAEIYLTEQQIAAKLEMSPKEWSVIVSVLEKRGLPRRDALFQDRRCWPAVEHFLIQRARPATVQSASVENYRGFEPRPRKSKRSRLVTEGSE